MQGEIISVWPETWREIWKPLTEHQEFGHDLISDLYREFVSEPVRPEHPTPQHSLSITGELIHPDDIEARNHYASLMRAYNAERSSYEEVVNGGTVRHIHFRKATKEKLQNELQVIETFEKAYDIISSYGDEKYSNRYFILVVKFLKKYNLRYELRRPFSLHPTLSGLFSSLISELKIAAGRDKHLNDLYGEFEDALRDLKIGVTPARIKTCMQKQFNFSEGLSITHPNARTQKTFGAACGVLNTWPHEKIREAAKNMYGFASDYPGIRHGGMNANALRDIEMRDLLAVSILMAGFAPYLTDKIDSNTIYGGS